MAKRCAFVDLTNKFRLGELATAQIVVDKRPILTSIPVDNFAIDASDSSELGWAGTEESKDVENTAITGCGIKKNFF